MNLKRRSLLKGMLASGAGGAWMAGSGLAQAAFEGEGQSTRPTLVLTDCAEVEASFGAGVKAAMAAGAPWRLLNSDRPGLLRAAANALAEAPPVRLIGLLDDASAELLIAQARGAGARMYWLGQHAAEAHQSRHQLIHGRAGQSAVLALGELLQQGSSGFALSAEQPFSGADRLTLSSPGAGSVSGHWAVHLGYALAAPGRSVDASVLPRRHVDLNGRFVSFVIEV